MAQVSVLNQFAGQNAVAQTVRGLLGDSKYDRLRVLMAFARDTGIRLIAGPLEEFLQRGGSAEVVVGLDLGGTSPEALGSLVALDVEVFVFGVKGDRTFHPKVAFLDGSGGDYAAVVGSSNWTSGGLDSNFEASLLVRGNRKGEDDDTLFAELDGLWMTYRGPAAPMSGRHLRSLDRALLDQLEAQLSSDESGAPDQRSSDATDRLFDTMQAPRAAAKRARRAPQPPTSGNKSAGIGGGALPQTLYLEVTGPETGGGREIQLPLAILAEYFGVGLTDSYFMTLRHRDGTEETDRPLQIYPANSTYRISSGKFRQVSDADRPVIVRLDRLREEDTFAVTIIANGTRAYADAEQHLTEGGGTAKRWGLA